MRKLNFSRMITLCTLCLCALAACIDHEPECDICDEIPDGRGILLSFDLDDDEQTRSTLQSSETDYKDVKEVYLYIFKGKTAEARCIHAEPVGWKGDITQKHWITIDLTPGDYTFMAVGVDDRAEDVYGFPGIIENATLGQCMAKLQEGKGKEDMAHAQFFVGYQSRTVTADVEEVALTLRRKVAGILVYLRNIPVNVTYKGKEREVKKLEVRLHKSQNTQLPIWKEGTQEFFGSEALEGSEVLFDVDLVQAGFSANGEYFTKKGNDSILDDSYLAGAYLLPIEKGKGLSTLSVNLLGTYIKNEGDSIINHPLKTYEVRYTPPQGTTAVTEFDIKENTLYSIGKKLSNSTTVNDKPADLSGNLLELQVLPWETIETGNSFPTVIGPTRIEAEFNDEKYIFSAWSDRDSITIKPAVDTDSNVKKKWRLKVKYEGNQAYPDETPTDWIHFESYDEGHNLVWTNVIEGDGTKEVKVYMVINDYAVKRELPSDTVYTPEYIARFKNDIRVAKLEVYTEDGGISEQKPYTFQIRQYNTLTIYSWGEKKEESGYRGICRLDYGCDYDTETGEVIVGNSAKIGWGYFETANKWVSGDNPMNYHNGEVTSDHCYERWKGHDTGWKGYQGSAIQRLTRRFIHLKTVDENGVKKVVDQNPADPEKQGEKNWYLPAYYEMWGVSRTFGNHYEALGRTYEEAYWTSSGDNGWYLDAYIAKIGVKEKSMQRDKDNLYHAMYMVHFD